ESGCEVLPLIGNAWPAALAADADGGLALAGESAGPRLIAGSAALEGPGAFLLRTDAGGAVSWIRGIGAVRTMALAAAPDGATLLVGQAQKQCLATKFDSRGRELWTSRLTGDGESACRAVAVDERRPRRGPRQRRRRWIPGRALGRGRNAMDLGRRRTRR